LVRKKLLDPNEVKAIDDFNSEMNMEIGVINKSDEYREINEYISMNPIVSQDLNELNLEIGTETGIPDYNFMDDEMYVDTGEIIPRGIIEEAERQFPRSTDY